MALRLRNNKILCAAIHEPQEGDTYIDDGLHYILSVVWKIIVTEPIEKHTIHGEWWWYDSVPPGKEIEDFYLEDNQLK